MTATGLLREGQEEKQLRNNISNVNTHDNNSISSINVDPLRFVS